VTRLTRFARPGLMHDEVQVETRGLARLLPDRGVPGHEVTGPPSQGLATVESAFELNQARGLTPLGIGTSSSFRGVLLAFGWVGCRHPASPRLSGTSFARPMSTGSNPWQEGSFAVSPYKGLHIIRSRTPGEKSRVRRRRGDSRAAGPATFRKMRPARPTQKYQRLCLKGVLALQRALREALPRGLPPALFGEP
jgi:hypothetical protein